MMDTAALRANCSAIKLVNPKTWSRKVPAKTSNVGIKIIKMKAAKTRAGKDPSFLFMFAIAADWFFIIAIMGKIRLLSVPANHCETLQIAK